MDFPHLIRKHTMVGPVSLTLSFCARSVAQSCPILCSAMHCTPPGSSVHGIFQARILESASISYSRGSSGPRDPICVSWVSCTGRWILYHGAKSEFDHRAKGVTLGRQLGATRGVVLGDDKSSPVVRWLELCLHCWSLSSAPGGTMKFLQTAQHASPTPKQQQKPNSLCKAILPRWELLLILFSINGC